MVDETENNIKNEKDDFPSFLRSDNQENDIDHFLDGEDNLSSGKDSIDLSSWESGFEDEEKNNSDLDFNLDNVELDLSGWDDIKEDDFLETPEDINLNEEIDLNIFSDEQTEETSIEPTADTTIPDVVDEIITDVESSVVEDEIALDITTDSQINIEDTKEVQYVDPEEYMSSDTSLEKLSTEEGTKNKPDNSSENSNKKTKKLRESTFIDDVLMSESKGYLSLLEPQVKRNKHNSDTEAETSKNNKKKEQEKIFMCQKYSGKIDDIYFEFSPDCKETAFAGNAVQNSIYVNVGTSSYGWNVSFDNGISMNLADVRIYQLRNGNLPADSGTLSYGTKKLRFSKVKRIVCAIRPQYFHYGV